MLIPKTLLLFWCLLLYISTTSFAQDKITDYDHWTKLLSEKLDPDGNDYYRVFDILKISDSIEVFEFFQQMENRNRFASPYLKAKLNCLKVSYKRNYHQYQSKSELIFISEEALNEAYKTGDDRLIAFICFICGSNASGFQEMELAAIYLLKGQELYERFDLSVREKYSNWVILGEVLFHCREYEKSIFYTRKVIETYNDTIANADYYRARFHNTMGQNFEELGNLDSALAYFEKSLELANKVNDDVWKGINSGFIGGVYYKRKEYAKAKPLLKYNFQINRTREMDHAAKSLQQLAAIDLAEGKQDSALMKSREALALIKKTGIRYYLQAVNFLEQIYYTTADVFRALGKTDSFYVYNQLYTNLHDSLQKVSILSSTKIAQLRIDNDNNFRAIQLLQREKQTAVMRRNFIMITVVLSSIILLLYLNRLRLKQKHRQEVAEAELIAAKDQMQRFTENIIQKTELIEKLHQELSHKEQNSEQNLLIIEITHQTILTEEDWENFKSLFEKVYPGFFINLKERAKDITIAEQRMAALTRLNLTTRQMASMLGISVDSVHKTKQRLRQRLHIPVEINLEESVASL